MFSNTEGGENIAVGVRTLFRNTTGSFNAAVGKDAMYVNTVGTYNTAVGFSALVLNRAGSRNTAVGYSTLRGSNEGSNGDDNIGIGFRSGVNLGSGSNNIDIGNQGVGGESNTIRIGDANQVRTFITGISGVRVSGGIVQVNANGQLGVAASSARFKHEIRPMDTASEAILALNLVTFCYEQDIDPQGTPQFGLIAEEVAKVNPALVLPDKEGKPYTVRYDQVNAMLLNEFLKEHRTVQELKSNAAKQEAAIARQQKQIEALTAGLQKVSTQLEASKPAPQVAENN